MTGKEFLLSDAGKGTLGVILTCTIIIFPIVGNWLVAGITLVCAMNFLFKAIDRLGQPATDTPEAEQDTEAENDDGPPAGNAGEPVFDVEAAMAELSEKAARTVRNGR